MAAHDPQEILSLDSILEQTLKDIGIPPRPEILERIAAEMVKDAPNFRHLGHLIEADVSLAASLIKTANSPFFGFRGRAHSTQEALTMLGLDVASRAIAGISLRKAFPADMRLERFWHSSAQIAALSGWLVQVVAKGKLRADDAHTFGLFRDCGIPVMLRRFPTYQQVLSRANDDPAMPFTQVEQYGLPDFPVDHALVGYLLAQNWWLPDEISLAIRHHHERSALSVATPGLSASSRYMIAIGQLAERLLQDITGGSRTCEWLKLGNACLDLLGLPESEIAFLRDLAVGVLEVVE
ncbi:MAG: HDOD domain-containing protein [Rhodocyclaceae bacterium]|nr:MAG: HDOD domain-containing protein [Rhodocyclaceae bacterium]